MDERPTDLLKRLTLEHLDRIEAQAQRRFRDRTLADEASGFALEQLQAEDWKRVRAYTGRASFATFLATVVARLLEDFSRQRFGRVRVPDWVQERGGVWPILFKLMCMERWPLAEAVQIAADEVPGGRDPSGVAQAARAIRARHPNCGSAGPGEVPVEDLELLDAESLGEDPQAPRRRASDPADTRLIQAEEDAVLGLLGAEVFNTAETPAPADNPPRLARLRAALTLSAEERLLLKLVFEDDLTVAAAGQALGLGVNQIHGRLRRLLARLRAAFESQGIRFEQGDFA